MYYDLLYDILKTKNTSEPDLQPVVRAQLSVKNYKMTIRRSFTVRWAEINTRSNRVNYHCVPESSITKT